MLLTSPISFPNLGITVDPSPVAFTIFGKEIYWYGIIIACGFLLAVLYKYWDSNCASTGKSGMNWFPSALCARGYTTACSIGICTAITPSPCSTSGRAV